MNANEMKQFIDEQMAEKGVFRIHMQGADDEQQKLAIQTVLDQLAALTVDEILSLNVTVKCKEASKSFAALSGFIEDIIDATENYLAVVEKQLNLIENGRTSN